jgi:5'-3' exonuclease
VTPLGKKKKDFSATIADDKGALCDLYPMNIIDMTDGDVPNVKHQAFEEYQKARREAEWKDFISGFRKTPDGEVVEAQEF